MIKFHYHRSPRDIPRIGVRTGDRMCHVYSDVSLEELEEWGRGAGLDRRRIHHSSLPHFDVFGDRLAVCGTGVSRKELVTDIRTWRRRKMSQGPSRGA